MLTLVTVSHNSAAELAALLDSVARHLPGVRTVVVDCASSDESVAVARARPAVDVLALEENIGFGRACNRGMELVSTAVTAFVNPDVELLDDSLLTLAAEALRADRPARLLAPRVLNGDGSLQDTAHAVPGRRRRPRRRGGLPGRRARASRRRAGAVAIGDAAAGGLGGGVRAGRPDRHAARPGAL